MCYNYLHSVLLPLLTWPRPCWFPVLAPLSIFPLLLEWMCLPFRWKSAVGESHGHTAGSCGHPLALPVGKEEEKCQAGLGQLCLLWEPSSTRILEDKLPRKDVLQSSQGFILKASGPPMGGGRLMTTAMQHPGRECWERAKPLPQNGPCLGSAETQGCSIREAWKWDRYCLPSFETSQEHSEEERETNVL